MVVASHAKFSHVSQKISYLPDHPTEELSSQQLKFPAILDTDHEFFKPRLSVSGELQKGGRRGP